MDLESILPALRGFLAKRVANEADREDLAQDILLRAWGGRPNDPAKMAAWVWTIARNAVTDYYRRRKASDIDVEGLAIAAPNPGLDGEVESWLAPMVEALPERYRTAVRLSELEGVDQAEVAARLAISVSGAKSRIQRGREKLRRQLLECCEFAFDGDGKITGYWKTGAACAAGKC